MAKKTFEENIRQITDIAEVLEEGNVPLEESLKLYKEAVKAAKLARKELDRMKGEIVIVRKDMDGLLTEEPIDELEF